ncbi:MULTISPECIES: hypothetical protein [Paenibacillus]|uniref:hypothetical protein n=1 Tax=Paenibacillus TaxID=44249 RepID=UPI000BD1339C|nr:MULTISPECIES: hypothetical protein [Paenibacillus]OZQ60219.1 hypothetical protein CA599_30715 [Paenibacillus taichungensis]
MVVAFSISRVSLILYFLQTTGRHPAQISANLPRAGLDDRLYFLSLGTESLLTLFGAEHPLGGIVGQEVKEITDEKPERVALIERVTWAHLRHALDI